LTVSFFAAFFRPVVYTAFDPEFAKTRGLPVVFIRYAMAVLMALAIVLSIRIMGIILVLSLFTIPQNTALLFTGKFRQLILGSGLFGATGSFLGLVAASWFDIPGSATIIFVLTIQFLLMRGIVLFQKRILNSL
jgi:zinc transport system permease protein